MTRYLEVEDMMHVLDWLAGPTATVRDGGLLVSALVRPRAQLGGVDVYLSLGLKAAALLTSLAMTQPLMSNNLRAAWVATRLFCAANGAPLVVVEDDVVETLGELVHGQLGVEALADRLGSWMTPGVL